MVRYVDLMRRQRGPCSCSCYWIDPGRLARTTNSVSKKDSDPALQGHTSARFASLRKKSTFAKSVNLIEVGAVKAPAECDIAQSSQIAANQITLQSGAHHDDPDNSALPPATRG